MSELAHAMKIIGNMGLNVIKYPSGKFGFVGRVPMELAYIKADGTTPSESECKQIAESSNPAMVCKSFGIKTRVFDTEQEARDTARIYDCEILN